MCVSFCPVCLVGLPEIGVDYQVVVTSAAAKVHYSISRVPESICVIIGVLCAVMLRIYFPQVQLQGTLNSCVLGVSRSVRVI